MEERSEHSVYGQVGRRKLVQDTMTVIHFWLCFMRKTFKEKPEKIKDLGLDIIGREEEILEEFRKQK